MQVASSAKRGGEFASGRQFVLLGGFLGAGKTTCLVSLAKWLKDRGLRCGLITNDQGVDLVDTATARADGGVAAAAVREITGGCFCCRSDELVSALRDLEESAHPDVLIAEPVGSCTDLVATVLLPLRQVYRTGLRCAPMSVVLDGKRLWTQYFGRARGGGFSKDVKYIFQKQMEEAEILVVNKSDLLASAGLEKLLSRLRSDYPGKRVMAVSARTGEGMDEWFELLIDSEASPERIMEVDYQRYGEGEALLGWFNGRLRLNPGAWNLDANVFLTELACNIQRRLEEASVEIAHFKMSFTSPDGAEMVVVNVVRNGSPPEISRRMSSFVGEGAILINLRAEGSPALIRRIVREELRGLPVTWEEIAAFRPARPKPLHRAAASVIM